MENPNSWGKAEHVVNGVLRQHYEMERLPVSERPIGWSLTRQITEALLRAGLLKDDADG